MFYRCNVSHLFRGPDFRILILCGTGAPPPNRHCLTQQYHVQVPNTVVKVAVPGIDQAARISKYAIVTLALESTLQWAV